MVTGKGRETERGEEEGTGDDRGQVECGKEDRPGHSDSSLLLFFFFFSPLATNLRFTLPLEASVCRRGVLKAAPVKAAIIITLRG